MRGLSRKTRQTAPAAVGYDGQAYAEGLAAHNTLAVEQPNGRRWTVAFDYAPAGRRPPRVRPTTLSGATAMRRALALFALGLFLPLAPAARANSPSCTVSTMPVSFGLCLPTLCRITRTSRGAICAVAASAPSPPQPAVTLTRDASGLSATTVEFQVQSGSVGERPEMVSIANLAG